MATSAICGWSPGWLSPYCELLPSWLAATLVLVAGALGAFGIGVYWIRFIVRWRIIWPLQRAPNDSRLPEQRSDAPFIIIQPAHAGPLDKLMIGAQWLQALIERRKPTWRRLTKDEDDVEVYVCEALARAGYARGLDFLPPKYRSQIHLRIALDLLEVRNAPLEAGLQVQKMIGDLGQDVLVDALFSRDVLQRVDCTPLAANQPANYFSRYFQSIMVAFSESSFRNSDGPMPNPHSLLLEHMKAVSQRRVRALALEGQECKLTDVELAACLMRPVPKGFVAARKQEVKVFNKKEAAHAVVMRASGNGLDQADLYAGKLSAARHASPQQYLQLTEEQEPGQPIIYLWQLVTRDLQDTE